MELISIDGLNIHYHQKSKRIIYIELDDTIIEKLAFNFKKFDILTLEYKPFSRFTIANVLDEVTSKKLSKFITEILKNRETGCIILSPKNNSAIVDQTFLVKLSTAIAHLFGNPNHDSMAGKYYARFHVKHVDTSDSYLRKPYTNMDLHTDGTYVKEKTDWLLMSKLEEKNVEGGESVLLHLDDWEFLEQLSNDPVGNQNFIWGSPKK